MSVFSTGPVAGMPFLMPVMAALHVWVIRKLSGKQRPDCFISTARSPAVKTDSCTGKCGLCPAADSAADQHIYAAAHKKSCKGAVSLPVGVYNFRRYYVSVFHFIYFKLTGMSKMLNTSPVS